MVRRAHVRLKFASHLHDEWVASVLGIALGISFTVCFATGMISHLVQGGWAAWPTRPVDLYRVTQGIHVATGIASVPLLLAKLWTVYPHLVTWPPVRSAGHAIERATLVPLVGGSLFMLVTGVQNIARWYVWGFDFTSAHYAVAWITIGALAFHVGIKVHIVRRALGNVGAEHADAEPSSSLTRRGFLTTVAAGSAALTVATIGQTLRPLRAVSVLAVRDPAVGPQGLPVNKSAASAAVLDLIHDPGWRLTVDGRVDRPLSLSLADLREMAMHDVELPIACVEGWSASGRWRGVPIADVLALAGVGPRPVRVESLQRRSRYRTSTLTSRQVADRSALLALELNGSPLAPDHGFPVRLIAPNRPGVLQTKWLSRVHVR